MTDHNLYSMFSRRFAINRAQIALETPGGRSITFAELETASAKMANLFVAQGLRPGDRVSVQIDKSPEGVFLYLACLRAGLVYHPLNTAYQRSELAYFLDNAQPSAIVCSTPYLEVLRELAIEQGIDPLLTLDVDGSGSLTALSQALDDQFATVSRGADDMAALLYSSGTTGRPKGIMLSHENLSANAIALVDLWGFSSRDVLLHALPIFHVHGLFVAINCALMSACKMLYLPSYQPQEVIRHLPDCTVMMGVPTYYTRLLSGENFTRKSCANMRLFISGSAPLLEETFREFEQRTGHVILERYGMSETSMNTSNPLEGERKAGTVGPPLPGVTVRIVDANGKVLPAGKTGDLQVKGPNVFSGYWRMPDKTAEDFTEDGFFNTGDKGVIDTDGYVSIVGRAKDMVISGGLNVFPKEVELLVDSCPGVLESAVIGIPHPDFGEAVIAVVVMEKAAHANEQEIMATCRDELANFKRPKAVMIVEELPRNAMGKVQKAALRSQYADVLQK
ncbi:MAG: malonyl-CoA synthase [Halioglobus sp.]